MNLDQMERMLENPMIQSQMQDMLSDPNVINMMMNNPMIKPLLDNNPMLRNLISNPEFMRNMMRPEVLRQMRDMRQNNGDFGGLGLGMGNPLLNNMFGGGMNMDCPKCEDGYMFKHNINDFQTLGSGRILIIWDAQCQHCGFECRVEEEFESTGYEEKVD